MAAKPYVLGRAQEKQLFSAFKRSALSAPSPRSGEVKRTSLPDTFDGIRYEIGRMVQYVLDSVRDPAVKRKAAEIQGSGPVSLGAPEGRAAGIQAIDEWCRAHFRYVNDPPNVEVIQTPGRMVKQTEVPPEVLADMMAPFYDAFARAGFDVSGYVPPPSYVGDCDEGVTAMTSLCACTFGRGGASMNGPGTSDVRYFFQFGGNDGTLHHVWAKTLLDGVEYHADHTEPGYKLGDHSPFEAYEDVEVEL